jgi:hypothetical protein
LATQKPVLAPVQSESTLHSTHWPAEVEVAVAQIVLPSLRVEQPVAPVVLQPVQVLATQKALDGLAVHWASAVHSTHWPTALPVLAQAVLPSLREAQPVAPGLVQPVQAPATQKALAGSAVHWLSAVQPTQAPEDESHVGVGGAQAPAPAFWQPVQAPATQKGLVGSGQSALTAQVLAASATRVSGPTGVSVSLPAS